MLSAQPVTRRYETGLTNRNRAKFHLPPANSRRRLAERRGNETLTGEKCRHCGKHLRGDIRQRHPRRPQGFKPLRPQQIHPVSAAPGRRLAQKNAETPVPDALAARRKREREERREVASSVMPSNDSGEADVAEATSAEVNVRQRVAA